MRKDFINTSQESSSDEEADSGCSPDGKIPTFRHFNGRSKQGPVAGGKHHTAGKAKHCVERPLAYISSRKHYGCPECSQSPRETCRQKSLDYGVKVLQGQVSYPQIPLAFIHEKQDPSLMPWLFSI
jgi:hypothetical protein